LQSWVGVIGLIQLFFAVVIGLYFWNLLKQQRGNKVAIDRESSKEMEELRRMRSLSLSEPLSEKVRPSTFEEIVGQGDGLKALRAALCGPNPQHVLLYGPPGVGKTAVARLVLEEAKKNPLSPFTEQAKFVEVDATTVRFDERGIADPLLGTVHDPIYQGAGPMGMAGIPQPKPGAVTKAHGGVLFIDEIGELHPMQINKLLKVLEDRKVFLESAYYNSEDHNTPRHIHDIFQNGLPADFRLIGATTKQPEDLPPAVRSRCLEIFFRNLSPPEIETIAFNASERIGYEITQEALNVVTGFAVNGREAVNMVQIAAGVVQNEERSVLEVEDMDIVQVVKTTSYFPEQTFIVNNLYLGEVSKVFPFADNIYIDITSIEFHNILRKMENEYGLDKFLFSSHCAFYYPEGNLNKMRYADLDLDIVEKVAYKNGEKLESNDEDIYITIEENNDDEKVFKLEGTDESYVVYDELYIVPKDVEEEQVKRWYDMDKPFFDPDPTFDIPVANITEIDLIEEEGGGE